MRACCRRGRLRPCCSMCSFARRRAQHRIRHRLQIVQQRDVRDVEAAAIASASTRHGTFVSSAVSPITGPATPKQAADQSGVPRTRSSAANASIIVRRSGELERRERATTIGRGRAPCGSNSPSSVLVPPMSPARIMCDSRSLTSSTSSCLLHLCVRFPLARRQRGGVCPSPSPDQSRQPLAGQLVVFTGKLSSLGRQGRARARRRGSAATTADDVNARTTMLVVGAEGFRPAARATSNKLRRAEELNAQPARPIEIITEEQFCRLAGVPTPRTLKQQYSRDARSARALSLAARGSPALSGEMRRHQAGAAHQRRHLLRVSRISRSSSRRTRS